MVGMVTECNHPMHWRPALFAFLRNGQAIIRRTINRSWDKPQSWECSGQVWGYLNALHRLESRRFFPFKMVSMNDFKTSTQHQSGVPRFNGFPAALFTFRCCVVTLIACGVFDYHSRQDISLVKSENLIKAGVEAEEAVEAHREKVERRVEKNRVRHHRPKRKEKWTC